MALIIARVTVPPPPKGDMSAVQVLANDPLADLAPAHRLAYAPSFLLSLAVEWAGYSEGRGYTAEIDDEGAWRCTDDRIAKGLNQHFDPAAYSPSVDYLPEGETAAVAYDVARVLGGTYEYVGAALYEEGAPSDRVY